MTYPPQPEPFAEALGEAAHTAAMAYRLVMAISDAVRRATQKRLTGKEEELGEDAAKMAPGWSADQLRGVIGDDILAELMRGADWPQLARQLVGLQQAGVDLGTFLPQMGRMTAGVHQAVVANAARIQAEGTDQWADLLKSTMPEGLVRDAILASPAWPDIAAAMGHLDARGIDVARILVDAHAAGAGVDQAVAAVTAAAGTPVPAVKAREVVASRTGTAGGPPPVRPAPAAAAVPAGDVPAARSTETRDPWGPPPAPAPAPASLPASAPGPAPASAPGSAPASAGVPARPVGEAADPWAPSASTDARRSWGPLTEGLEVPRDLDLGNRPRALKQLNVSPGGHSRMVSMVREVLPEREAGLLIGSRQWPLLAARMQKIGESDGAGAIGAHLARLGTDTSWREGPASALTGRLVDAALRSLTVPPTAPAPARVRVSAAAARSRSTTTPAAAAPGQPAPAEAAVPAHRRPAAPARGAGRTR
ncbi:hypothetical protein ACFXPI_01705 [Streptomyces sp. NPDC059104]|uniref:hypothetical protein n=1 Tax=Streptomyces sp. NPDC059104 TaxID=3346729 RepID=UPI0036A0A181